MSITYASNRNVASKGLPANSSQAAKYVPRTNDWVRPAGWTALPEVTGSSEMFAGLFQVYPGSTNYVALTAAVSTGSYVVDWGDGSSPVTYSSNTQAQYIYPDTGSEYQCVVTVTPVSGSAFLTRVDLNVKYTVTGSTPTLTAYTVPWLDIAMGGSAINSAVALILGQSTNVKLGKIQQVKLISTGQAFPTQFLSLFSGLTSLRSVIIDVLPANYTTFGAMYLNCHSLTVAPEFPPTTNASVSLGDTFSGCRKLTYVPDIPVPISNLGGAFQNCSSLIRAPKMTITGASFSTTNTFSNCTSLIEVPDIEGSPTTIWGGSNMFSNCFALVSAPYMDTSRVNDMSSWFSGCRSLVTVPLYNTANLTTMNNMFLNCASLLEIPPFNTSNVSSMTSFAAGCSSITDFPQLDLANATNMFNAFGSCSGIVEFNCSFDLPKVANATSLFSLCTSLETGPLITTTSNLTSASSMFANCNSLTSINSFDTSSVTSTFQMFFNTTSLVTIPVLDTSNATNTAQMFACQTQGTGIQIAPNIDISKSTNTAAMFQNTLITDVPLYDTSKSANVTNMFTGCNNVTYIPAMNLSNSIATTSFATGGNSIMKMDVTGMKVSINISQNKFGIPEIESFFDNLGSNATVQTVTITGNPGADTPISKTTTTSYSSGLQLNLNTTTGLVVGMKPVSGNLISGTTAVSGFSSTNDISLSAGFTIQVGSMAAFTTVTGSNFVANKIYYVKTFASNRMTLSETLDGPAITITANFTGNLRWDNEITSIVNSTAVLLKNSSPTTVASASAINFRQLNTYLATLKNWTISG